MNPLLDGTVHHGEIDDWIVSWETAGPYRHWCRLDSRRAVTGIAVLHNPGSLTGAGDRLRRDTTLRVLRRVGQEAGCNWLVLNLFDFAAARPADLHANWAKRDPPRLVFDRLDPSSYSFVIYGYGDVSRAYAAAAARRIDEIRRQLRGLSEVRSPLLLTRAGNPMHPINWQRRRLVRQVADLIKPHLRGA